MKTSNNNDFIGFTENINKNQKKDLIENNTRRPLIIINPIFDNDNNSNEINNQNRINPITNIANQDNFRNSVNKKSNNISDKISIGYIII